LVHDQNARCSFTPLSFARFVFLLLNSVIIAIIGYFLVYYRASFRSSLFQPELMLLVCSASAFINTSITIISSATLRSHSSLSSHHSEGVSSIVCGFILALAAMVLLIQLSIYQNFLVEQFEAKVFAGVLALITSLLYFLVAAFAYKTIKENM